jgi:hypothetical protein
MTNGHMPESVPPGNTIEERVTNTWRAVREVRNLEADLFGAVLKIDAKVVRVMAKLGITSPPDLVPMRAELDTVSDLRERAIEAAAEGERRVGTDAATEVRRLFDAEEDRRASIRNAQRLAQIDADAAAAKKARRKFWMTTVSAITGGLGLAGAIELVKWLSSLHH